MKHMFNFVKNTFVGGILFLLPLTLLIFILKKAFDFLASIAEPFAGVLPDEIIFGLSGKNLLGGIILVFICFVAGLLFKSAFFQRITSSLEEKLLIYIPGYSLLKSVTADALHADSKTFLKPILVHDGDSYKPGFLVEEGPGELCTVFIPEAPHHDAGEVSILNRSMIVFLKIPNNLVTRSLRMYGRGASAWLSESDLNTISEKNSDK